MPRRSRSPLVGSGTAVVEVQEEFKNLLAVVVALIAPKFNVTGLPAAVAVTVTVSDTM